MQNTPAIDEKNGNSPQVMVPQFPGQPVQPPMNQPMNPQPEQLYCQNCKQMANVLEGEELAYLHAEISFFCDPTPILSKNNSSSSISDYGKEKPRSIFKEVDRNCNLCAINRTSKWYKDHEDEGKHICKKCYNTRYKNRRR
ncbi:hypothetical protein HDV04_000338 [Boothiomyces sp. JEL0838]|nr:hypothetical protein HDV04_000338 [Boothiomyces sp. JEL0838]